VLCTKDDPYISHQRAQDQTWAHSNPNIYWLLGDPQQLKIYELIDRFLSLKIKETFENILEKTVLSFRWALKEKNIDFYIRTNTSTYINISSLEDFLRINHDKKFFAAALKGVTNEMHSEFGDAFEFLAGNMMIFSKATVELLSTMDTNKYVGISDDVAISSFLKQNGVELSWIGRNEITDYQGFRPNIQHRVKSWSNSMATIDRMYEVHRIYTETGFSQLKALLTSSRKEIARYRIEFRPNNLRNLLRNIKNIVRISISLMFSLSIVLRAK
jgi:hypothetical protein